MKVSLAALLLLLLLAIFSTASASYDQQTRNVTPSEMPESVKPVRTCCFKYTEKALPKNLVVGYREYFNCLLPAIIFVTKKNREVCTNPNEEWVQQYIKDPNIPLMPPRI